MLGLNFNHVSKTGYGHPFRAPWKVIKQTGATHLLVNHAQQLKAAASSVGLLVQEVFVEGCGISRDHKWLYRDEETRLHAAL